MINPQPRGESDEALPEITFVIPKPGDNLEAIDQLKKLLNTIQLLVVHTAGGEAGPTYTPLKGDG